MTNLRHLVIRDCDELKFMPLGMENLTSLQSLTTFSVGNQEGASINELKGLNQLRGRLVITDLANARSGVVEKCLDQKEHLQALNLCWGSWRGKDSAADHGLLELLQPHTNLEELRIEAYTGVSFPSTWMMDPAMFLQNLVKLEIKECTNCRYLPPLGRFPRLTVLILQDLNGVEYLDHTDSQLAMTTAAFCPCLEELRLRGLSKLKGWWKKDVEEQLQESSIFPSFSRHFVLLETVGCDRLDLCMPLFPYITARLDVIPSTLQRVRRLIEMAGTSPVKLMDLKIEDILYIDDLPKKLFQNLCFLHTLTLRGCHNLGYLQELGYLEEDGGMEFPCLRSLSKLELISLPELVCLPKGLQHIPKLENLLVIHCVNLALEWMPNLNALRELQITGLPKLVTLPENLQYITTLTSLRIGDCPNLRSLPEWVRKFTALRRLDIYALPLMYLPEGLQYLATLQNLSIINCRNLMVLPEKLPVQKLDVRRCPDLAQRYRRGTGEDWPKIAHIPYSFLE